MIGALLRSPMAWGAFALIAATAAAGYQKWQRGNAEDRAEIADMRLEIVCSGLVDGFDGDYEVCVESSNRLIAANSNLANDNAEKSNTIRELARANKDLAEQYTIAQEALDQTMKENATAKDRLRQLQQSYEVAINEATKHNHQWSSEHVPSGVARVLQERTAEAVERARVPPG